MESAVEQEDQNKRAAILEIMDLLSPEEITNALRLAVSGSMASRDLDQRLHSALLGYYDAKKLWTKVLQDAKERAAERLADERKLASPDIDP